MRGDTHPTPVSEGGGGMPDEVKMISRLKKGSLCVLSRLEARDIPCMNPDKISAERDALLKALTLAEKEIARARAAQQQAEAKVLQVNAELLAQRSKSEAARDGGGQAVAAAQAQVQASHAAQRRAEAKAEHLEAQLRGVRLECETLQSEAEQLRAENEELRARLEGWDAELQEKDASILAWQKDAEDAKAEVERLRAIVMTVAIGAERPGQSKTAARPREGYRQSA